MKVDIETIWIMDSLKKSINTTDLEDIEFYEYGKKIDISGIAKKEFELTGLSNIDFITTGKYKKSFNNNFPKNIQESDQ